MLLTRNETATADVCERVYEAARPELFFKAIGWRVVGDGMPVRTRSDRKQDALPGECPLAQRARRSIIQF